ATDNSKPALRLLALAALDGWEKDTVRLASAALGDDHPGVRRHAIRIAEKSLNTVPELGKRVIELATDSDAQVRLQAAYSLGAWGDPRAGEALGRMALQHSDDAYLIAAVLSSVNEKNLSDVLTTVLKESGEKGPPPALVTQLMRVAIARKNQKAQEELLSAATT